jgi:hypothetical protein
MRYQRLALIGAVAAFSVVAAGCPGINGLADKVFTESASGR